MTRNPLRKFFVGLSWAAGAWWALPSSPALACGGFFCSQTQPVNQAAERIMFAQNDDNTVTAVIQIMYEGPSEHFSWLLPIATVPDADQIAVSSDVAFQRLQLFTNPQYNLTTRVEGTCDSSFDRAATPGANAGSTGGGVLAGDSGGNVTIEASGVVGSFEWTVISFNPDLDDPADAAVMWLEDNDYDVTQQGADLIGPYLEDGMYLLALKLVKGADTGSIRPIVLTYGAGEPMIPIKLTAVAANDDMGVMAWLLANERAVPRNYLSLELNEAQINWFNAASNYNDVVISAAQEAGGQGFVTEFAGASSTLSEVVWSEAEEQDWEALKSRTYSSFSELFDATYSTYGSWDGFWDAARNTVTLSEDVSFEDFKLCPYCYDSQLVSFSPSEYLTALEDSVIEPVRLMQDLLDGHEYATRLYTTMSAADMTLDPAFTFNGDLADVDNIHTAERIIECNPSVTQFEAPWRIELPQGGVIRGAAADVGSWPTAVQEQPANLKISQLSATGKGTVLEDNAAEVKQELEDYNDSLDLPGPAKASSGGCSMSRTHPLGDSALGFGLLGLSLLGARRKRQAANLRRR